MSEPSCREPTRVLLVEDNPGDVRLTREAFAAIDGDVEFQVVPDGEAAVKYIREHFSNGTDSPPEMILLDLNLPRVDGFGVLEILDEDFDTAPPVLVLSSSETEADVRRSYQKGANAYLAKPDSIQEFEALAQSIKDFWIDAARTPVSSS